MIPVSYNYMEKEGSSITITNITIQGSPHNVVFIADPHIKPSNLDHINATIETINSLNPSVVLIGGDFTYLGDGSSMNGVLSQIDAPVYAVLGNHDYMSGMGRKNIIKKTILLEMAGITRYDYDVSALNNGDVNETFAENIVASLEKANITVLRNEDANLYIDGQWVHIVGLDDCWAGKTNPSGIGDNGVFTIYMVHEPECVVDWGADIVLAGHTHGGQILFGLIKPLELSGMMDKRGAQTYVTRGIGTSSTEEDLRLFAPPEIVVINPP
jgi:hypothetical protein